jgi:hypothetical protein
MKILKGEMIMRRKLFLSSTVLFVLLSLVVVVEADSLMWSKTYGGLGIDIAYSVIETSDRGYAIAGDTSSSGAGGEDFWLIKTDEDGFVPEYSSWLLASLLLTATLVVVIYKKKLLKPRS